MKIYESSEDYLEAILALEQEKGNVHSVDIADLLGFSKASVSVAMKKLRQNGYIKMDRDGEIHLLEPGRKIAEDILERHRVLTAVFVRLGVDPETAAEDACKVEHDLSVDTFNAIKDHIAPFMNHNNESHE